MVGRLALLAFALTGVALAQEQERPPQSQSDLQRSIDELEQRNQALEQRLDTLEQRGSELAEAAERAHTLYEGPGLGLSVQRGEIRASLQVFGDTGFEYQNPEIDDRAHSSFFFGSVSLFATAQVGEHFQVLSETSIKSADDSDGDPIRLDQERLWGSWTFGDDLYLKLGLEHGPISRWNRLYHHGRWLETTIQRPLLARFEGNGGFLPMHNSGLEVGGECHTGAGVLEYVGVVSNGRGRDPERVQETIDRNDSKALDVGAAFSPEVIEGLRVGANFRADEIPSKPSDPMRRNSIRELIETGSIEYSSYPLEVISEVAYMQDHDRTSDATFHHQSAYVQVGYHLDEKWTPYIRSDYRQMEAGDPFLSDSDVDLDRWEQLFGIRCELTRNAAVKLEFGFGREQRRNDAGDKDRNGYIRSGLQLSFVF